MHHHQPHFDFQQQQSTEYPEAQLSYAKILQWSIEKIAATRNARQSSGVDLRRSLLIAGAIGKARAGILRQRAMQFLEARPQLLPPTGWHTYHCSSRSQQLTEPEPLAEPETQSESAFGYSPSTPVHDNGDEDEDALSVSADAIVMSSVELSISDLEEDADQPPSTPSPTSPISPTSRKRKQQSQEPIKKLPPLPPPPPPPPPPAKRTRHPGGGVTAVAETDSLRSLRTSFVDMNILSPTSSQPLPASSGAGCRLQASQFAGALVPWPSIGPECHAFA